MTLETCSTCTYWDTSRTGRQHYPAATFQDHDEDSKQYLARRQEWETTAQALYGQCQGIPFAPVDETPLAFVIDVEDYSADLWTQAGFSCALWASK